MFGFAVSLGGVWTREVKSDALCDEEGARGVIIKFTAVVSLHRLEWKLKLGANICVKVFKH